MNYMLSSIYKFYRLGMLHIVILLQNAHQP